MLSYEGILQTLSMIDNQKLDIRTITMGISLMDCADSDGEKARQKIYNKIVEKAGHLVEVGQAIEKEFGIPIINKRYTQNTTNSALNIIVYSLFVRRNRA